METPPWPLSSPRSLGVAVCFLLIFSIGFAVARDPNVFKFRKKYSYFIWREDRRVGHVLMCIFGPLALVVLVLSWLASP
jgi:hypothetical protein